MSEKYKLSEIEPLIREVIDSGNEFTLKINGKSMYPLLEDGRDSVVLVKINDKLRVGDIAFFKRDNGQFVLHRVVGIKKDGYVMRGDNQSTSEHGVSGNSLIAVAQALIVDGKRVEVSDKKYLEYVNIIRRKYPIRRVRYLLNRLKSKVFGAKK